MFLLAAIASLAYKRGHFAGTFIPSPFQILFVVSVVLTIIYVMKEQSIKEFFKSLPRKITVAFICVFTAVIVGWVIGGVFAGIPTTYHTILDFGTFTMSIIIFFLVLFYIKDDRNYATWCLYALLIPSLSPFYYFFTHGFVGYWGVLNDGSLNGVVDPNLFSKTLLIPTLFFISTALFALMHKKWWLMSAYTLVASLYAMLIFWTVSRGSILSLLAGSFLVLVLFSARKFSWKKLAGSTLILLTALSFGYVITPGGSREELRTKVANTGALPRSAEGNVVNIVDTPNITMEELRETPRTDVRIFEWYYFLKYAFCHPLGVGPSSSSVDYQDNEGDLQLRPGNTYIQLWLWGGIVALTGFLYVIWRAFVSLWTRWRKNANEKTLAIFGALFALSIAIIFDASLYFYWYFILLALAFERSDSDNDK